MSDGENQQGRDLRVSKHINDVRLRKRLVQSDK
jgi:hypothetical protein